MVHWHDTDATYLTVNYNEKGQVLSLNSKEGYFQDEFIYDEQQKKTIYLDAEGGRTEYHYNEDNLVTRIIDPLGHEQTQEWLLKTKISQIDALGRKTYFYHNEFDDITKIEFSDGYQLRFQYNAYGQITSFKNGTDEKWQYCYDKWGSLVKVIDPCKRWVELCYGDRSELLRKTLSTQESWRYYYDDNYDDNKQLQAIEDSRGRRNQYHIDLLGRLHAQTNTDNETICYHHSQQHANPAGSVTEIILPGDIRQHITYNSERLISTVTDGEGKQSSYRYGALDLLLEHTRPNGSSIKYHYDKLTRLAAITNALGERYQLTRDKAGRIVQETDFTGRAQYYQYDAVGRMSV